MILLVAQPALASSHEDCALSGACCFPRGEPGAVRQRMPRLATLASITVGDGGLIRPVVRRVLAQRTAALGACATGTGELHVHLVISPAGGVQVGGVRGTPALVACATDALRSTAFPATTGVTELELRLTW